VFAVAHLLTWTHHGQAVPMSPAYETQLRRLRAMSRAGQRDPVVLRLGERARIVAQGRYHGAVGTLVKAGRTRYHLRIPEGVLTVPFEMVEPVD
jgi:hypothetical protein